MARFRWFLEIWILLIAAFQTQQVWGDAFITETSPSARSLGMGDAGINSERGPYAVFYNPASLAAKNTGINIQAMNFQIDANGGLITQAGRANSYNVRNLSSLYNDLKKNTGTFVSGRFSVFPNITLRNFHLGILYEFNQGAVVDTVDQSLRVKARDRFAPTAALSFRLFNGIFRIGASSQYLTVGDADRTIQTPISSSNLDFKNSINSGSGLVNTAGATLTLPFRYLPSFSFVYRNIGGAKFNAPPAIKFGNLSAVEERKASLDAATALTVYLAKRLETKWEFDIRDYSNTLHSGNQMQHYSMGTEWTFFDKIKLRGGLGHGYLSAGFGVHTQRAQIDLAWYSDELDGALRSRRDQRVSFQFSWGLFK